MSIGSNQNSEGYNEFMHWMTEEFQIDKRTGTPIDSYTFIVNRFHTAFRNNIKFHWYQRLRNVFKYLKTNGRTEQYVKDNRNEIDKAKRNTLKFLNWSYDDEIVTPPDPDPELIDFVRRTCAFPDFGTGDDYFDSGCLNTDNWYRLVPGFIRLQRFIEEENIRRRQNGSDNINNWKHKSKGQKRHRKRKCERVSKKSRKKNDKDNNMGT